MEFRVGKVENVEFKVDPSFWRVDTFELDGPTYLKEVELFFGEKIDFMVVKKKIKILVVIDISSYAPTTR